MPNSAPAATAPRNRRLREWFPPCLACLVFAALSLAMLPYPGLQDDELIFTVPIFSPQLTLFSMKMRGMRIPLMLIGYLGTLKTWLYSVLFPVLGTSRWAVRTPMVLAGVLTICLTWMWTRRIAGPRAAAFTVALLSADAVFVLTNTFDWGPVALQHLLLVGGLLSGLIWHQDGRSWMLALGCFLWGLGLWDKALFVWPLGGLAVAAVCVYPRHLARACRPAPMLIAAGSLFLGALPLIWYNVAYPGETASGNVRLSLDQFPTKVAVLRGTLDGSVLLDFMVATEPGPVRRSPKTIIERISVSVNDRLGEWRRNWMMPALALSFTGLVFLLRTPRWRFPVFLLIAASVGWLQMAMNAGTGGGAHHSILLWPLPCIFVGATLGPVADRAPGWLAGAITAFVVAIACGNALNTNEYLANLIRNGTVGAWTDATYRLSAAVQPYQSERIGLVDWGYLNGLQMNYRGGLKMVVISDLVHKPEMTGEDRRQLLEMLRGPHSVFVRHTEANQLFPGVNEELRAAALSLGYAETVESTVSDDEGRQVFEIVRFVR